MSLFGTSGIRRIADKDLVLIAVKAGMALGSIYHRVIVGSDTRTSSESVKSAFFAGLLSSGSECFDAGVVPTPTLAVSALDFDCGVMITASHNPPEYNGIKFFNPDGSAFDEKQRLRLEGRILSNKQKTAPWQKMKSRRRFPNAVAIHTEKILKQFPKKLKTRVVLDCGCGAASVISPYILREMGCELTAINSYPSGFFPRHPEPTEESLEDLMKLVKELKADAGIAHDGDADRMMTVDDKGRFISGDRLLAIFVRDIGAKEIITTVDASMAIDEIGLKVKRTPVGDPYVSVALKEGGDFGGEPSGSWIFPKMSLCPDGIYAAAVMSRIAGEERLSTLVDEISSYPIMRGNVANDGIVLNRLEKRLLKTKPLSISKFDGLKLNFKDGWALIRPSGTEPKIRLTVEAKTERRLHEIYDRCFRVLEESRSEGKT